MGLSAHTIVQEFLTNSAVAGLDPAIQITCRLAPSATAFSPVAIPA